MGGRDSEGEGSMVMDTSGDSDMEGVGWVAGGERETEGFSDRGRRIGRGRGEPEPGSSGQGWWGY